MPISVSVPPRIAAYDSGRSSFDGEIPDWRARSVIIGMNTATTGVLLRNPDSGPVAPTVAASARPSLPRVSCARYTPSRWTSPVCWIPALSMNIATIVIVAVFENPEIACWVLTPVTGSRAASVTMTPTAVISFGIASVTNNTSVTPISPNTTTVPSTAGNTIVYIRLPERKWVSTGPVCVRSEIVFGLAD